MIFGLFLQISMMGGKRGRIVLVSYRLPFKIVDDVAVQTSGGLVSAILSLTEKYGPPIDAYSKIVWIGFSEHTKKEFHKAKNLPDIFDIIPVHLDAETNKSFYDGFANNLLWPLFHYFPTFAQFDDVTFEQYQKANALFCDAVSDLVHEDDVVWVHDYHFFLLPQMLRARRKDLSIGFFLHIPFPSFEIFRLLPNRWRKPLINGILGADLIGFHTLDYVYYFLNTIKNILGIEHYNRMFVHDQRKIKVEAFPISIDYEKFKHATTSPGVLNEVAKLRHILGDQQLIFSVDRLDYTKGLIHRLEAFELFLKEHPEWQGRVMFNMVVVPSRDTILQYQEMRNQIDALVGRMNSEYSSLAWRPVTYQYKSLGFDEMVALYHLSNIGLITPVRDGMNLVAKEYVASQHRNTGVLILSEMTGAAAELTDALIINPTDKRELADAILHALEMPAEERQQRMTHMQHHLRIYDVMHWTTDFLAQLQEVRVMNKTEASNFVTPSVVRSIIQDFNRSEKRILFFDYDGTLVPYQSQPEFAIPDEDLIEMLRNLAADPRNLVVIISGRDKTFLTKWFGNLHVTLAAEHGAFTKMPHSDWIKITSESTEWKSPVIETLEMLVKEFPGSRIEMKDQSVTWHYRNAINVTQKVIERLKNQFRPFMRSFGIQLLEGNKAVEVKHKSFNKGTAVQELLSLLKDAFMLAIGDDRTDEDLFRSLPLHAYTIKVGNPSMHARYYMPAYEEVRMLIHRLIQESTAVSTVSLEGENLRPVIA